MTEQELEESEKIIIFPALGFYYMLRIVAGANAFLNAVLNRKPMAKLVRELASDFDQFENYVIGISGPKACYETAELLGSSWKKWDAKIEGNGPDSELRLILRKVKSPAVADDGEQREH